MSLVQLATWILVALAGAIAHEVAHWLVWLASGRRPKLHLWQLTVVPRDGSPTVTAADRVAAAAPYLIGACSVLWGVVVGGVLWVIFGVAMIQLPSRADIETMRGRVQWRSLA